MYNEINLDKMNIDYNIKTVGSINELQEEYNGKTK